MAYEDGLCSLCAQECGCWRVLLKRHQQAFLWVLQTHCQRRLVFPLECRVQVSWAGCWERRGDCSSLCPMRSLTEGTSSPCFCPPITSQGELHKYCTAWDEADGRFSSQSGKSGSVAPRQLPDNETDCGWAPFDKNNYQQLLGALDYSFLCAYAVGMYLSGIIGERLPIRYYLTFGMLASGAFTALFGLGYFYNIHSFGFYVVTQVINGLVQTTGWPSVVTCLGNWFGKGRRGLIMGVWNSHTSVGNILGSLIAGYWVSTCWGLSFVVPGAIVAAMGIVCFLFLIELSPQVLPCCLPWGPVAYLALPWWLTCSAWTHVYSFRSEGRQVLLHPADALKRL